jgi:hypothetical protein
MRPVRVRFGNELAPAVDPMQRVWDRVSMVGELPRRRDGQLIPVERPLGDTGATVFVTSDRTIYERRANGVIRRVKRQP